METALNEAGRGNHTVVTLGPLIHNPIALELLAERGVDVLDERALPDSLDGITVVIRAHGVAPKVADAVAARGGIIVDATCPRVRLSQMKARKYASQGYVLFLAGESDHGEIIGIAGWAPGCLVVSSPDEARKASSDLRARIPSAKTALIGQTTIKTAEYAAIAQEIKAFFPDLKVFDSICPATTDRQEAMRELCGQTDAVIVVGGRNSANTKRLYLSAVEFGKPAWLIEDADEVPGDIRAYGRIGLTAGASTPDSVIDAVEEKLRAMP
jgi:4-hydroxy-3-methylbut-2-enyl diphosphate reductase